MLIQLNIENHRSFEINNSLDMTGVTSFKENEPQNVIEVEKEKILKTAAIYGNNASGKSNLLSIFSLIRHLVLNSVSVSLNEEKKSLQTPYLLNTKSIDKPTKYEVIFQQDGVRYRYGFSLLKTDIYSEWLYSTVKKETLLFERNRNQFNINRSGFKEGLKLQDKTRENALFLTVVAQFNGEISKKVLSWFSNTNIISGLDDGGYAAYTIMKLKNDENFKKWISIVLDSLEITNVTVEEIEFEKDLIISQNPNIKVEFKSDKSGSKNIVNKLQSWHKRYDENKILIDSIPFDLERQESEGTKKLIYLLGPIYDTLKNGKLLIVDELDSRLHPLVTRKIIEFFHIHNTTGAQLIFTCHDVTLLSRDIFRRDQIWFTEKDQFGASILYSLADFKSIQSVRKNESYFKNYLDGKYGATSYFEISERIIELLNANE